MKFGPVCFNSLISGEIVVEKALNRFSEPLTFKINLVNIKIIIYFSGAFTNQLNICDGAFLQKYLTAFSRQLFSQKIFIEDVRLSSEYVS